MPKNINCTVLIHVPVLFHIWTYPGPWKTTLGVGYSGNTLFAQACLPQYVDFTWYVKLIIKDLAQVVQN